jgi:hypothetical protein
MKVRLFSKNSNPSTDSPLCHKSQSYVQSLIDTGEAIMLACGSAQLTGWIRMRQENADQKAARRLNTPLVLEGANSCRLVNGLLRVRSFPHYPIPACGAWSRPMKVKVINKAYASL